MSTVKKLESVLGEWAKISESICSSLAGHKCPVKP